MKVFLSVASLRPAYGGPAFSVSQLAGALAGAGAEVGLWAPDGSAPASHLVSAAPRLQPLSGSASEALAAFGKPDVLHDNGIWLPHNHQLARAARRIEAPRIVSTRGMLEPWAMAHKALKKKLAWQLYQRRDLAAARLLHATAEAEAENVRRLELGPEVVVVPNGVTVPPSYARQTPNGPRTALFVGRIYPVKGLPMLVRAWGRVRPAGWRLDIAGPDEAGHRAEVEAAVRSEGLADVVRFLGPLDGEAKTAAYAGADLFILPSHSESFGMAVGEALAHGLPVLTTLAVPWPQLEADGSGWRVPASVEGLADGLARAVATEPEALRAMGEAGRRRVVAGYSWDAVAQAFLRLYEKAAA